MALEVEDGTGLATAESVLSIAELDAMALRENWSDWPAAGVQVPAKEAAARKANRWAESRYVGRLCSSIRANYGYAALVSTQARLFPMSGFVYPDGRTLLAGEWLPREWALVVGLATRRAILGTLSPDTSRDDRLIFKRSVTGAEKEWAPGTKDEPDFHEIDDAGKPLWSATHILVTR